MAVNDSSRDLCAINVRATDARRQGARSFRQGITAYARCVRAAGVRNLPIADLTAQMIGAVTAFGRGLCECQQFPAVMAQRLLELFSCPLERSRSTFRCSPTTKLAGASAPQIRQSVRGDRSTLLGFVFHDSS